MVEELDEIDVEEELDLHAYSGSGEEYSFDIEDDDNELMDASQAY